MSGHSADIKAGYRFAAISDIHGNVWALESVLDDISRRGIDPIVNLGDCLYGPLEPAAVADILIDREILTVRGNEDRLIVEEPPELSDTSTLDYVKGAIGKKHIEWLRSLPGTAVIEDGVFLCHGSPTDDTGYLLRIAERSGVRMRGPSEVRDSLSGISEPLVLCGHDHVPFELRFDEGRLVVDPGSVGLPAYSDDIPVPHVMEAGSPHARYSILTRDGEGWRAERVEVEYDQEAAARKAGSNGRDDWSIWLRSGKASV
jgi:diadenosine tetraphosphatase ApaH/serine/threonine PP2A family protein phosphatase